MSLPPALLEAQRTYSIPDGDIQDLVTHSRDLDAEGWWLFYVELRMSGRIGEATEARRRAQSYREWDIEQSDELAGKHLALRELGS